MYIYKFILFGSSMHDIPWWDLRKTVIFEYVIRIIFLFKFNAIYQKT